MDKNISKQRKTELTQRMYKWLLENEDQFKELMAYYRCALMEVSTKFNVLQEELSLKFDRNPIESIKTRLKTPESILEKLDRKGLDITIENPSSYNCDTDISS